MKCRDRRDLSNLSLVSLVFLTTIPGWSAHGGWTETFATHAKRAAVFVEKKVRGTASPVNLGDAAEQLLQYTRETHYQHRTHVDVASGIYDMDCSGFVDFLLNRIAPEQFAQLPVESGHSRPRAAVYYDFLNGLGEKPAPGWEGVDQLSRAQRGDIIAWKLVAARPGDTGHVIIVAAPPMQTEDDLFRVKVYDSSAILHDDDSRLEGTSGIGSGVITFKVDPEGRPIGFRFNSHGHFHLEPISIGRLTPLKATPRIRF